MKKKQLLSIIAAVFVTCAVTVCVKVSRSNDPFERNVEVLTRVEPVEICTSPKTWLGLGTCMNVTSIICKDNSGKCD